MDVFPVNTVSFQGQELRFVGREDFIAMKAFAGRALDLADALRAILAAGSSLDLVRHLARAFGKDASESLERIHRGRVAGSNSADGMKDFEAAP